MLDRGLLGARERAHVQLDQPSQHVGLQRHVHQVVVVAAQPVFIAATGRCEVFRHPDRAASLGVIHHVSRRLLAHEQVGLVKGGQTGEA